MKKYFLVSVFLLLGPLATVSAHVVVKPAQVGLGAYQTFTVGVPVEKEVPTTGLRLVIPLGLEHVSPNVKPGWKIDIIKSNMEEKEIVSELRWTGGPIPPGQRDEFVFSAKVPAEETVLMWNAYQTYADGTVVSWDQPHTAHLTNFATSGPHSVTNVMDDLRAAGADARAPDITIVVSFAALILSLLSLLIALKKKSS